MQNNIKPNSFAKLKRNHLIFGFLYLLVGLFIIIGSFTITALKEFKPGIYTNLLNYAESTINWKPFYEIIHENIIPVLESLPFMLIIGTILLISALIHILLITKNLNPDYNNKLQKGLVPSRWIEAGFASVLLPLLAIIIGVNDISVIILLLGSGIVYNFFAYSMEQINSNTTKTKWNNFIGMLVVFIVSATSLFFAVKYQLSTQQTNLLAGGDATEPYLKTFNFIVLGIYFGFWLLSLIHTFLQHKKIGPWKNFVLVENIHIVLNFVAKLVVVGMVFYGLINGLFTLYYSVQPII